MPFQKYKWRNNLMIKGIILIIVVIILIFALPTLLALTFTPWPFEKWEDINKEQTNTKEKNHE